MMGHEWIVSYNDCCIPMALIFQMLGLRPYFEKFELQNHSSEDINLEFVGCGQLLMGNLTLEVLYLDYTNRTRM